MLAPALKFHFHVLLVLQVDEAWHAFPHSLVQGDDGHKPSSADILYQEENNRLLEDNGERMCH